MKKILALALAFLLLFSTVGFAAVSSSGRSSSPSRPSTSTSVKQAAPSSGYKPSAPAGSYSEKAPSGSAQNSLPGTGQTGSTGGFWRNAGWFGGGMLMGSLFGHMFGWNSMGMMPGIFGWFMDIVVLALLFMGIRALWRLVFNRNRDDRRM